LSCSYDLIVGHCGIDSTELAIRGSLKARYHIVRFDAVFSNGFRGVNPGWLGVATPQILGSGVVGGRRRVAGGSQRVVRDCGRVVNYYYWKFVWKNRNFLMKLPEEIAIFRKFTSKNQNFFSEIT